MPLATKCSKMYLPDYVDVHFNKWAIVIIIVTQKKLDVVIWLNPRIVTDRRLKCYLSANEG